MSRQGAIGLTGGIACGKSEVAGFLSEFGVPVLDTDLVAHGLLEPKRQVFEKVVQAFGKEYLNEEGTVDRRKLGSFVFANKDALKKLNSIMHPEVFLEIDRWLTATLKDHKYAVVMIPLLYETASEGRFDKVIVVASDDDHVEQRMKARGLTREESQSRIHAQMRVEEKAAKTDFVVWNNGDLQELKDNTVKLWNTKILERN